MSHDLYLVPARAGRDADHARAYIEREQSRAFKATDVESTSQKRELANLLLRLKPTFLESSLDFKAIADWEEISVGEARLKYRYIEIDGASGEAQFVFHDNHVVIHWYGMPSDEMGAILCSLSLEGNFVVFDPQADEVHDLRE